MISPFAKIAFCETTPRNADDVPIHPFNTLVAGRRIALASTNSKIEQYAKDAEKKVEHLAEDAKKKGKELIKSAEGKAKDLGKQYDKSVKEVKDNISYSCDFGSPKYYALCGFGGIVSCGLTHTLMVPLDLVKCRLQVDPAKYKSIGNGFSLTVKEGGMRSLGLGWAPTLIGYSMQGLCKFGFYEVFKVLYADMLGDEKAYLYRTSLYLAASASAEVIADIALAPMEAVKVRMQTSPGWSATLREGAPRIWREEGLRGFYKGLPPLWGRQIPYTMMKFAAFERTVEMLYQYVVPKPRAACSKSEQLMVTFAAGYIAGVFCAIVSHPADTIVSKLNNQKGSSMGDIARQLGFMGMWKGLTARIIMIGTLTALQWFIYDGVKVYFRMPRPPPPEMPLSLKAKLIAQGKLSIKEL